MSQFLKVSAGFGFGSAFCRPYSINWNCKKYSKAEKSAKYIVRYIGFIFFPSFGHPRTTLPAVTPSPSTLLPQHKIGRGRTGARGWDLTRNPLDASRATSSLGSTAEKGPGTGDGAGGALPSPRGCSPSSTALSWGAAQARGWKRLEKQTSSMHKTPSNQQSSLPSLLPWCSVTKTSVTVPARGNLPGSATVNKDWWGPFH